VSFEGESFDSEAVSSPWWRPSQSSFFRSRFRRSFG